MLAASTQMSLNYSKIKPENLGYKERHIHTSMRVKIKCTTEVTLCLVGKPFTVVSAA